MQSNNKTAAIIRVAKSTVCVQFTVIKELLESFCGGFFMFFSFFVCVFLFTFRFSSAFSRIVFVWSFSFMESMMGLLPSSVCSTALIKLFISFSILLFLFFYYNFYYIFYFIILLCLTTPFIKRQVIWITEVNWLISSCCYFVWFVPSIISNSSVRNNWSYFDVFSQYKNSGIFLYFEVFTISLFSSLQIISLTVSSFTSSSLNEHRGNDDLNPSRGILVYWWGVWWYDLTQLFKLFDSDSLLLFLFHCFCIFIAMPRGLMKFSTGLPWWLV